MRPVGAGTGNRRCDRHWLQWLSDLAAPLVAELGLPFLSHGEATLADGSDIAFDVWEVTVLWDGATLSVEADLGDLTP